ncbi:16S rRNA (cytosine(967)-C(5))-methyltransferase RsmB [Candidatus Soleaferrea massiliensis]|uniref:16S rRNA (cytosine(967)-C(5))-methyltransferase RsmB n=1 Tax=Candidatus Soleaferrea massiliensis TaxID=1470354 RepID=UPI00058D8664|nr:16S rRNA (cytosine(967)-C(5))-methyltransferase RsmB [Candidatus Soleaferrea massiliensis]
MKTKRTRSARQTVVDALIKVNETGGYSNIVIDKLLEKSELSAQDKSFATMLFYGVLERKITLDYMIAKKSNVSASQISREVREILRSGCYQLFYMDSVPDSAAVNESVQLAKNMGRSKAAGFINAVMRAMIRDEKKVQLPSIHASKSLHYSVKYSCPQWLIEMWTEAYGEEKTIQVLESSIGKPPVFARVNSLKTTAEELVQKLQDKGIEASVYEHLPYCVKLGRTGDILALEEFQNGEFHIQDLSSQYCCCALDAKPGERIIDLCAAPGGKAFTVAQYMQDKGSLLACDIYRNKLNLIRNGAVRLDIHCIDHIVNDASVPNNQLGDFDRVLCDVPCSGLGIIRRKPEIKYKDPAQLENLPDIQFKILQNAAKYLKVGGRLIYSTCALNPKENDEVVARFLENNGNFKAVELPEQLDRFKTKPDGYKVTLFPDENASDGFFICCLEKMW